MIVLVKPVKPYDAMFRNHDLWNSTPVEYELDPYHTPITLRINAHPKWVLIGRSAHKVFFMPRQTTTPLSAPRFVPLDDTNPLTVV